jgi:hypothetical protein
VERGGKEGHSLSEEGDLKSGTKFSSCREGINKWLRVSFLIWYVELVIEGDIMEARMSLGSERTTHKSHLELHPQALLVVPRNPTQIRGCMGDPMSVDLSCLGGGAPALTIDARCQR